MSRIRNLFEKVCSLLMAACMILSSGTAVAFAAGTSYSDAGTITVSGLESGVTVSAYKIAEAEYDDSGNFLGYKMTVTSTGWSIASDGSFAEPTEQNLADLWKLVSGNTPSGTATANGSGVAEISNLGVGSYLIVVTGSETTVYSMMIGSVSYASDGGDWSIDNGSIDVTGSNLWVKAAQPTIDKEEVGTDGDTHGDSASAGDEVTFHVTVENIPQYNGDYPEFEVHDVLTGLTISESELSEVKITVNSTNVLTEGEDYTVTKDASGEGFTVSFVVDGSYTLNDYAGGSLVIEYKATVSETESDDNGVSSHSNDAELVFSTNSYVEGSENDSTKPGDNDTSYEYTFSASIKKVGTGSSDTDALSGAEFAIYDDSGKELSTASSGSDGYVTFTNLHEGTYTFKETKAPAGYALDADEYHLTISAEYESDGTLLGWTIDVTDSGGTSIGSASNTNVTNATITNTQAGSLPSMGGMGTMLFTVAGAAVILCALIGMSFNRRRQHD